MSALAKLTTVSCSTKRPPALSGGKRAAPAENLTGLLCTPLDPLDPETQYQMQLETPMTLLQTFLEGDPDIKRGDTLVVSSTDYPIRAVESWPFRDDVFLKLIIEVKDD